MCEEWEGKTCPVEYYVFLFIKLEEVEEFVFILCREVNLNLSCGNKLISRRSVKRSSHHQHMSFMGFNPPPSTVSRAGLSEVLGESWFKR